MNGFETLEIVIGLVFVYLLFSILVTLVVEYISAASSLRAKNLKRIIQRALDDNGSNLSAVFYNHPSIKYLGKKDGDLPSNISSDKFAKVVLDLIRTGGDLQKLGKTSALDEKDSPITKALDSIPMLGSETKSLLQSMAKEAGEDINDFGNRLESMFNETVERGQGWFNREIKKVTFVVSIVCAIALNIDSVSIYHQLSTNADLRTQIADGAAEYMKSAQPPADPNLRLSYDSAQSKLVTFYEGGLKENTDMLKVGWDKAAWNYFTTGCNFLLSLLGWLISGLAISLGAPFWFDLLNKLVAIRSAGKSKDALKPSKRIENQINIPRAVG
ncbi:MAG: hypothetical protein RIF33_09060 [Cyclobacteriaceae bacterium]